VSCVPVGRPGILVPSSRTRIPHASAPSRSNQPFSSTSTCPTPIVAQLQHCHPSISPATPARPRRAFHSSFATACQASSTRPLHTPKLRPASPTGGAGWQPHRPWAWRPHRPGPAPTSSPLSTRSSLAATPQPDHGTNHSSSSPAHDTQSGNWTPPAPQNAQQNSLAAPEDEDSTSTSPAPLTRCDPSLRAPHRDGHHVERPSRLTFRCRGIAVTFLSLTRPRVPHRPYWAGASSLGVRLLGLTHGRLAAARGEAAAQARLEHGAS